MNGTIITDVNVYQDGQSGAVMLAKVYDRVVGTGTTITKLSRNGRVRLEGVYKLGQSGCVAWDETPPPDPTPTKTLTHTIKVYSDGSIDVDGTPYT